MEQVVGYLAILLATLCFLTFFVHCVRLMNLPLKVAAPWPYVFFPFLMLTRESNRYSVFLIVFGLLSAFFGWFGSQLLNWQIVD
jgi:hypothetical protein